MVKDGLYGMVIKSRCFAKIRVENTIIDGALVPTLVDYDGERDIPMKKRELVRFVLEYSGWRVIE